MPFKEGSFLHDQRPGVNFAHDPATGAELNSTRAVDLSVDLARYGDGLGGDFGGNARLALHQHRALALDLALHGAANPDRALRLERAVDRGVLADGALDVLSDFYGRSADRAGGDVHVARRWSSERSWRDRRDRLWGRVGFGGDGLAFLALAARKGLREASPLRFFSLLEHELPPGPVNIALGIRPSLGCSIALARNRRNGLVSAAKSLHVNSSPCLRGE